MRCPQLVIYEAITQHIEQPAERYRSSLRLGLCNKIEGEYLMNRLFALLVLACPLAAFGATNPDSSFFKHAAEGGIAEVDAGNLAQQKANAQNVKDFGAMMVKDHSAANEKLQAIAAAK